MKIKPFELERYFVPYEFSAKYLLCSSDCDGIGMKDLVAMADDETSIMWEQLHLGYTESQGLPLLRQEIAKLYQGIGESGVLIVAPEEGIFLTMNTLLDKGDHIIVTYPGYQSLYSIAEAIGCEITRWEANEQEGWRFDPDLLESQIKSNTKMLVINFPHNPTGYLPNKDDYLKIIRIAQKHNLYVFSDEMYYLLEYNSPDRLPPACEIYDKAISLFGMSKTFGMAGLRIGWLITKDHAILQQLSLMKDYLTICSSAPSEILALIGLRAKDKIIERNLATIENNLKLFESFVNRYPDLISWVKPKAGSIAFPKFNIDGGVYHFADKVVKEARVMILPSKVYGWDDQHFRVGFGRRNFPEALQVFEDYLNSN